MQINRFIYNSQESCLIIVRAGATTKTTFQSIWLRSELIISKLHFAKFRTGSFVWDGSGRYDGTKIKENKIMSWSPAPSGA